MTETPKQQDVEEGLSIQYDPRTAVIIGAAIEVHRALGPGLLESVYEECLCHELTLRGIPFRRQLCVPIEYKGMKVASDYRLDLLVDDQVVVELKATERLLPLFRAQVLSYLRLSGKRVGLIINFNVPRLAEGIVRMVL